jgi:RNA polymerase sigma-70 factor (ECF subfamily)
VTGTLGLSRQAILSVDRGVEADERAIVESLRQGDARAFDAAYALYRARLYGFLARSTRDRALAEDLLQETWLRLATHAHRLAPDTHLAAWLFTVARNLHVSHRRWNFITEDRLRSLRLFRRDNDPDTPFDLTAASQAERRLEHAVAALPPAQREVLLLVTVEGFEPAEVARMLGLKPEAIRQRLSRARAFVEAHLGGAVRVTEAPAEETP